MTEQLPYNFIAIEGNIGSGKTTLASMLSERFSCRLILEQFTDNPFLPYFYQDPERYGFPLELFFMTERYKQMQLMLPQQELFVDLTISDYFFFKTLLFARNNLQDEEFRMFQKLFSVLNASFPKPDIILFLHRSVDSLLENIKSRGRSYESAISRQYLQEIQNVYFEYFRMETSIPVVILDVDRIDFQNDKNSYEEIINCLKSNYLPGMHQLILSN